MPRSRERRHTFFDHFLKGRRTALAAWPKVRLEIRERAGVAEERAEAEWPLARTNYRPLWLDASAGALLQEQPPGESAASYDPAEGQAVFDFDFAADTELTGHMKLRLWVESDVGGDMDLFVAVQKLDRDGKIVGFCFYSFYEDGPVALGWLRTSHRSLDPDKSTPWQPFHSHDREEPLAPGEAVPVDIEIWPSATLFRAGETLRLIVSGKDIYAEGLPGLPFARHERLRNRGLHLIRTGGRHDSHLLVPEIPPKEMPQ
jgi:hypothetical protein